MNSQPGIPEHQSGTETPLHEPWPKSGTEDARTPHAAAQICGAIACADRLERGSFTTAFGVGLSTPFRFTAPTPDLSGDGRDTHGTKCRVGSLVPLAFLILFCLGGTVESMARSTPRWQVFEEKFTSSRLYENPPQEVRLTARFVSPSGRTNRVHGFWNGGKGWAVRFSPDELGDWTFQTDCSDPRNAGLHGQSGRFQCTVQPLETHLQRHGGIRVAKGASTFQHDDGTPFFWTADDVWAGPRLSTARDWETYVHTRARQGFNVAVWRAAPGNDERGQGAFTGSATIQLDPGFFRRLDDKVTALNDSGMVSAIAPLWEIGLTDDELLPEDQVIALLREMVGRWDAYPVAWVIAFEPDMDGRRAARWRRIGRNVFDRFHHAPVILFCGSGQWALKEFADEAWVDAVAFQSGNDVSEGTDLWLAKGPATKLWMQKPVRPVLNLLPAAEAGLATDGRRINTREAVEAVARSLFVAPPAGVCYQSRATAEWDQTIDTNTVAVVGEEMPEWQKSLYLPGATRIGQISKLLRRTAFEELAPSSSILLAGPPKKELSHPLSALANARQDCALIYVPEGQTAWVLHHAVKTGAEGTFFSLQTGSTVSALAHQGEGSIRYALPGPGDWLLLLAPPSR